MNHLPIVIDVFGTTVSISGFLSLTRQRCRKAKLRDILSMLSAVLRKSRGVIETEVEKTETR
jgi:hypothetical protein